MAREIIHQNGIVLENERGGVFILYYLLDDPTMFQQQGDDGRTDVLVELARFEYQWILLFYLFAFYFFCGMFRNPSNIMDTILHELFFHELTSIL